MPLNKNMSHEDKVKELMLSYEDNGKIGKISPKNKEEALKFANAIAYSSESLNFKLDTKIGLNNMKEQLIKIKELLDSFPIVESQLSQTRYDQESKGNKELEPEDDKSFEEDRIDLEEILSQPSSYKKNYIKKVVKAVNKLIDGTEDVDSLVKTIKCRKKKCK